jgi:thymidylate synthase
MAWPILYSNILRTSNLDSPLGIVTMWSERDAVAKILSGLEDNYCVIGNLYGQAGITPIIRNVFAKPTIRKIILWGADLSRSGQSLIYFMENGVGKDYKIIGDERQGLIEKGVPKSALDLFRKSVEVINLRGKTPKELRETVEKIGGRKAKPFSRPKEFSIIKTTPFTYPSEQVGFKVYGRTVAQTWLKVLNNISRYGRTKKTRYTQTNELKEVLNLMAVVYNEDPENIYFPHYLPFTKRELLQYYPQVLSSKPIPNIAYTYGQRLRDNEGVDQIGKMIELLKDRPFSKKMAAFTTHIEEDWNNVNRGDTPCLTQVLGSVQDDTFFFTVHFRSQDMVHGWPRNMFSLRKLQKLIIDEAGGKYKMGPLTIVTHSAHIYSDDYELVSKILEKNYLKEMGYTARQHFEDDPRGNFLIEVNKSKIMMTLFAPGGGLALKTWEGRSAYEIYTQITDWDFLVMPSHLIYIGTEIQRAEDCLIAGMPYHQDPAPGEMLRVVKERMKKGL